VLSLLVSSWSLVLGAAAAAAPSAQLWLDTPVALGEGVAVSDLAAVGEQVRRALTPAVGGRLLYGPAAVVARATVSGGSASGPVNARSLFAKGKDLYMGFEFAPAAAALAEAAGLLTTVLATLEPADVQRLYEARLLEGVSWVEAGQPAAANAAFQKLLTIRPDFEPDPRNVPPSSREVFKQALTALRAVGLAGLQVRSEPAGAEIFVDGLSRGRAPLTVSGLPAGTHGVRVTLPGYQTATDEVTLKANETATSSLTLLPRRPRASVDA
jgi:hypothetical protein